MELTTILEIIISLLVIALVAIVIQKNSQLREARKGVVSAFSPDYKDDNNDNLTAQLQAARKNGYEQGKKDQKYEDEKEMQIKYEEGIKRGSEETLAANRFRLEVTPLRKEVDKGIFLDDIHIQLGYRYQLYYNDMLTALEHTECTVEIERKKLNKGNIEFVSDVIHKLANDVIGVVDKTSPALNTIKGILDVVVPKREETNKILSGE
ncbi:MAG: hypothetical protein LBO69_01005 [Ignavibacteria bacterium]|jgi:hypothetical protein|nr:hypothetical protein [Ignavibacteria bacterium]